MENFKIIKYPELSGKYLIGDLGTIKNLKGQILRDNILSTGYKSVMLKNSGFKRHYKIHRLVAEHYVINPKPGEFKIVHHINHKKLDNFYQNLSWTSPSLNMQAKVNSYLVHPNAKLLYVLNTKTHVETEYESLREAARELNIPNRTLSRLLRISGSSYKTRYSHLKVSRSKIT